MMLHEFRYDTPIPLGAMQVDSGSEPSGFTRHTSDGQGYTGVDVVAGQLRTGARMVFLDARTPSDYVTEHIAGAISVPFYDVAPYVPQLPRDTWLVCYCACPHELSSQLAETLLREDFDKVTVLDEGIPVWRKHGYPTHSGREP
jgi:cytochrome c oxidase cbb3-type subunit 3/ubiquinol-cytochrome c reductase cytochrome c subunit